MLVNIGGWYVNPLNVTYVNPSTKEDKVTKENKNVTEIHFGENHYFWTNSPSLEEIQKIISDGLIAIQKGRFSKKRKTRQKPKKQQPGN